MILIAYFEGLPWYMLTAWSLLGIWTIYSFAVIFFPRIRNILSNYYLFETIPNVFVTIGLLGTFIGISYSLIYFKPDAGVIKESIAQLLEGLKTAFLTSVYGIMMSLITGKFIKYKLSKGLIQAPETPELRELKDININITRLRDVLSRFSQSIADDTVEAVMESLRSVINDFNESFKNLIGQLVEENFQKISESIDQLIKWQQEYKNDISNIKDAYNDLVEKHKQFVDNTENWVENLDEIAGQSSQLKKIVDDFNEAFSDDSNFRSIIDELKTSTTNIYNASEIIKENSKNLQEVNNSFVQTKEQIKELTDSNQQVSDMIKEVSNTLETIKSFEKADINALNDDFNNRLKSTFQSLDSLMKEYIQELENRQNGQQ